MEGLQEIGIQLIQLIQTSTPNLDAVMTFFTFLGKVEFYMIFITFLYWILDTKLGFQVFMMLLSTDLTSMGFKKLLHQPRPYWIGEVAQKSTETSYGLPSSHASDSLSVWSYLAYNLKRRWFWIIAILLILLISFSRLYLGVHFPHDLLGGWLIGLVVLMLFIRFENGVVAYLTTKTSTFKIILGFVISLVFILIGLVIQSITAGISDPPSYSQYSIGARSLTDYFTLAGAFMGSVSGYVLMKAKVNFFVDGTWTQKIIRYMIGIVGVLITMYGLDILFGLIAVDDSVIGYVLRYIRYGSTTFWVMVGAPWVFGKFNLYTRLD